MLRLSRLISSMLLLAATSGKLLAQPAPPPPPGMPAYVTLLEEAFNGRKLDAYAALFQQDVKVYRNGVLIAADQKSFRDLIRTEFDRNLHVTHLSWAQGNQILVMEQVQGCIPTNINPGVSYHPCYSARAIRYDLANDRLISAVHILDADSAWNIHPAN
jgi:hypothetical protein